MENNTIQDRTLGTIDTEKDSKVRVVGVIESVDDSIGTFVLSDEDVKVTCLPPVSSDTTPKKGERITLVGRAVKAGNDEMEIRTDHIEQISEEDYKTYNSYLKKRSTLLNNGS